MRSDAELVDAAVAGDKSAFAELVGRHERSMLAIAYSILHDHHAAEDAVQDAFIAAYRDLPALRKRGSFFSWTAKILGRVARDAASRRRDTVPLTFAAAVTLKIASC